MSKVYQTKGFCNILPTERRCPLNGSKVISSFPTLAVCHALRNSRVTDRTEVRYISQRLINWYVSFVLLSRSQTDSRQSFENYNNSFNEDSLFYHKVQMQKVNWTAREKWNHARNSIKFATAVDKWEELTHTFRDQSFHEGSSQFRLL